MVYLGSIRASYDESDTNPNKKNKTSSDDEVVALVTSTIGEIRQAAANANLEEVVFNSRSKLISFQSVDKTFRLNVYYTTGTVGTCITHPSYGKTQLFRRNVNLYLLKMIMTNPRTHTNKGYYQTNQGETNRVPNVVEDIDFIAGTVEGEDELSAFRRQQANLAQRLKTCNEQILRLENIKLEEEKRIREAAELKRRKEAQAIETERKIKAQQEAALELKRAHKAAAKARLIKEEKRGTICDWSLQHANNIPDDMSVACVAIGGGSGGFVAIRDSGSFGYHGPPSNVQEYLDKQHQKGMKYLAIGPSKYSRYGMTSEQ